MLKKFKNLTKGKKIIVGVLALVLLPITLIALSLELAINGAKNKKFGKMILGICTSAFLIFSFLNTEDTKENNITSSEDTTIEASSENSNTQENLGKETLSSEELISKLETYEGIYALIPAAIQEASQNNDKIEMQKTFASGRDTLERCWQELSDLKRNYDSNSNEYKAIDNLHLAFFTLRDACKSGIKYLDKDEYKYFEKYEQNCNSAGAWINDYLVYKEKIQ